MGYGAQHLDLTKQNKYAHTKIVKKSQLYFQSEWNGKTNAIISRSKFTKYINNLL